MKRKNDIILFIFCFLLVIKSYSQSDKELREQAKILWKNAIEPTDTYDDYIKKRSNQAFSYQIKNFKNKNSVNIDKTANKLKSSTYDFDIIVIAESGLYNGGLEYEINRYMYDIQQVYNYDIVLAIVSGGTAENIKSNILEYFYNPELKGVVLIGNIPVAWYEMEHDFGDTSRDYAQWPMDIYYMDLDGIWEDNYKKIYWVFG
jgi:hypothetical protein